MKLDGEVMEILEAYDLTGVKSRGVVSFRCSLWVGGGQAVR